MKLEINTVLILKVIGTLISLGTLLWLLAGKFNDAEVERTFIRAKLDMLLEERMSRMERTELYNRMNEVLTKPSSKENYSLDRYMNPKNETKQASKK